MNTPAEEVEKSWKCREWTMAEKKWNEKAEKLIFTNKKQTQWENKYGKFVMEFPSLILSVFFQDSSARATNDWELFPRFSVAGTRRQRGKKKGDKQTINES